MSITSVKESPFGRAVRKDKDGKINATRVFLVATDSPADFLEVLGAAGIPAKDDPFPGLSAIVAQDIRATDRGSAKAWRVTVEYGPQDEDEDSASGGNDPNDPTDDPVKIRGGSEFFTKALQRDLDGKPVVNSVEQPFDQPLEREIAHPYLLLERNESSAPYAKARQYTNTINNAQFYGAPPKTLLCHDISFNNDFWQDVDTGAWHEYWVVQYKFLYNAEQWNPFKVYDVGYREQVGNGPIKVFNEIDPDTKLKCTRPKPLKEGKWVPLAAIGELEFRIYVETDFGGLGLGNG